jgi:hypothetical protein
MTVSVRNIFRTVYVGQRAEIKMLYLDGVNTYPLNIILNSYVLD